MQQPQAEPAAGTRFSVGSILSRSFAVLAKNPTIFLGLTFVAMLPGTIADLLMPPLEDGPKSLLFLSSLMEYALILVSQGAVAYAVFRVMREETVSFNAAVSRGLAHLVPLILAAILMVLGIGFGMLAIIPGLVLTSLWVATIPACVVERLGATASIQRSMDLTLGYRLRVFFLVMIALVVNSTLAVLVGFLSVQSGTELFSALAPLVALTIPQAFTSVMNTVIYYELRRIKEGVSLDALANVFD